jgi:hypothetical protein
MAGPLWGRIGRGATDGAVEGIAPTTCACHPRMLWRGVRAARCMRAGLVLLALSAAGNVEAAGLAAPLSCEVRAPLRLQGGGPKGGDCRVREGRGRQGAGQLLSRRRARCPVCGRRLVPPLLDTPRPRRPPRRARHADAPGAAIGGGHRACCARQSVLTAAPFLWCRVSAEAAAATPFRTGGQSQGRPRQV